VADKNFDKNWWYVKRPRHPAFFWIHRPDVYKVTTRRIAREILGIGSLPRSYVLDRLASPFPKMKKVGTTILHKVDFFMEASL
jgi:hypothetical protein